MWGPAAVTDGAGPKSQQDKERGVKLPQVGLAWNRKEVSSFVFILSFSILFSKAFLNRILRANKFQQMSAAQINKDAPA